MNSCKNNLASLLVNRSSAFFSALLAALGILISSSTFAQSNEAPKSDSWMNAGYEKGFFIVSPDENFKLIIQGRIQSRFTHEILEGDDKSAFSVPRARLTLKGHIYHKDLKYKLETDYGKGVVTPKDFVIDYAIMPKTLIFRIGQSKRPFSRQQINSSGRLNLVDRAITDKAFGAGRDIGFSFHNNYEKSPTVEWSVGLYNGTGDKGRLEGKVETSTSSGAGEISSGKFNNVPDLFNPAIVVRLGYNYGGIKGYSEADFEGGGLRFGVAASAMLNLDMDEDKDSNLRAEVDFILKHSGFSASGAYYTKTSQDGDGISDQASERWGAHFQAGYLLAEKYHPAVRYALVDHDGHKQTEMVLGFSSYYRKHSVKWQTDVAQLATNHGGSTETDYRVRTQLQVAF